MTSAPQATPQRIRAARLLAMLDDVDGLATEPEVVELAALDPDAAETAAPADLPHRSAAATQPRPASA